MMTTRIIAANKKPKKLMAIANANCVLKDERLEIGYGFRGQPKPASTSTGWSNETSLDLDGWMPEFSRVFIYILF